MAIKYAPSTGDNKAGSETKRDSASATQAKKPETANSKKSAKAVKETADDQGALPGVETSK